MILLSLISLSSSLQFFRFIEHSGRGGESLLVDGFQIAANLRQTSPKVFSYLLTHPFHFRYLEDGISLENHRMVFRKSDTDQSLEQIAFNNDDRVSQRFDDDHQQVSEICSKVD